MSEPKDLGRNEDPKISPRNVFALRFHHKNHKVCVNNSPALNITNHLTLECWIYLEEKDCTGYFIVKKSSFALAIKKQHLIISMNNTKPGWVWKNTKQPVELKRWTYLVVTYNGTLAEACVYVNGSLAKKFGEMVGPLDSTTNDLYFGLHLVEDHIFGNLSDVRIWKRVLSESEIREYISDPPDANDKDLVGWWPLDRGYGVEVLDKSPNNLRGEITGAKWVFAKESDPYPSTLQYDMKSMFNSVMGSDLKLKTKDSDQTIYAHKVILCCRCEVFKAMLWGGMKECQQEEVVISDIKYSVLSKLVEFLYTDNIELDGDTVLELFQAADKYALPRLKHLCERFMLDNISLENVCTMLESADQLHATLLRGECIRWILENFGSVLDSEPLLKLPKRLMREIFQAASKEYFSPNGTGSKRRRLNRDMDVNNYSHV